MKKVDVFVDDKGQPQHLAVKEERSGKYRAVCGANITVQEVKSLQPSDVKTKCADCYSQLKMWIDVIS